MDELVDLDEELDLADAAAAALEVEARAERLALRIMVADPAADRADLADRAEIERAPPDERVDRLEEIAAERRIAGDLPGADEGRALPGQSRGFVIGDGRIDRQRDRGHFGRGAKAQVDAEGIALLGALLQDLDDALADAQRRLLGLLARLARQGLGVVEEDEIDVRRIIELAPANLPRPRIAKPRGASPGVRSAMAMFLLLGSVGLAVGVRFDPELCRGLAK